MNLYPKYCEGLEKQRPVLGGYTLDSIEITESFHENGRLKYKATRHLSKKRFLMTDKKTEQVTGERMIREDNLQMTENSL